MTLSVLDMGIADNNRISIRSSVRPCAVESSTQRCILVRQTKHMLRQLRTLNNTLHLQRTFLLNKFAHRIQQTRRKLFNESVSTFLTQTTTSTKLARTQLTSEYHRYCQQTSLITAPSVPLTSPLFSHPLTKPLIALGLNRIPKHICHASAASSP